MSDNAYRSRKPAFIPIPGSLFDPATLARRSDPETSKAAARSLDNSTILARLAEEYRLAGSFGLTDEEAGNRIGIIAGAWKRCSDLRRSGVIVATKFTRNGSSGRAARVCIYQGDKA